MQNLAVDRRGATRHAMVLAAEVIDLPRGAKLHARTSDISRSGCYIDTLNPVPKGSTVRIRLIHHDQVFEALGTVVYVSHGLGMGINFSEVAPDELAKLEGWLSEVGREF